MHAVTWFVFDIPSGESCPPGNKTRAFFVVQEHVSCKWGEWRCKWMDELSAFCGSFACHTVLQRVAVLWFCCCLVNPEIPSPSSESCWRSLTLGHFRLWGWFDLNNADSDSAWLQKWGGLLHKFEFIVKPKTETEMNKPFCSNKTLLLPSKIIQKKLFDFWTVKMKKWIPGPRCEIRIHLERCGVPGSIPALDRVLNPKEQRKTSCSVGLYLYAKKAQSLSLLSTGNQASQPQWNCHIPRPVTICC